MNFLKRCCESKRECLTYIIVLLWVSIGILATYFETDFTELAAYFISLTGFAGAYMYGESVRKSQDSSIFKGGKSSKRELMIYLTVFLWLIIGVFTVINQADLMGMSAYFAALTPFVGSYIIGETVKKESEEETDEN
tara:strand:+ start:1144 stop:1554 length:411 start_codon:yes stop_codon:yes gene_type:complete